VKPRIWAPLACLAVFMMFAGPALAQEDESASAPSPTLQKHLDDLRSSARSSNAARPQSQQQVKNNAVTPETSTCAHTFTSGSSFTYLQFCVTVNGNIVEFQSPGGVEQIRQGSFGEGYGICDLTENVSYFDYADDGASPNWNAPVLISSSGSMVKISRGTSDGLWLLTQTITNTPGTNPSAKVTMQLKNTSGIQKAAYLIRWADVDPGKSAGSDSNFQESFDSSFSSAWGYVPLDGSNSGAPSYGLMFQNSGSPVPASVPYGRDGFDLDNASGPDPCNPAASFVGPLTNTDGSTEYLWLFDPLNKQQAVSVTGKYFSF